MLMPRSAGVTATAATHRAPTGGTVVAEATFTGGSSMLGKVSVARREARRDASAREAALERGRHA
jgi:hypothetical protein